MTKIKIDSKGFLYINRAGKLKAQVCPYSLGRDEVVNCGDWCPLFSEPEPFSILQMDYMIRIRLCNSRREVCEADEFVDERK